MFRISSRFRILGPSILFLIGMLVLLATCSRKKATNPLDPESTQKPSLFVSEPEQGETVGVTFAIEGYLDYREKDVTVTIGDSVGIDSLQTLGIEIDTLGIVLPNEMEKEEKQLTFLKEIKFDAEGAKQILIIAEDSNGNIEVVTRNIEVVLGQGLESIVIIRSDSGVRVDSVAIALGEELQLEAILGYIYGKPDTVRSKSFITWKSALPGYAEIDSSNGLVTTKGQGETTITVSDRNSNIAGSLKLTVEPAKLKSIEVAPEDTTIASGEKMQFRATGTFTDSTRDITSSVEWVSNNPTAAEIDSSTGLATTIGEGQTDIVATHLETGIDGSTSLTVGQSKLIRITIVPGDTTIAKGQQVQFAAEGVYTDTTRDITSSVEWVSSNPSAAAIDSRGLATGVTPGDSTQITAKLWEVESAPSVLIVKEKELKEITVEPESPVIALGESLQFQAILSFTDGTEDTTTSVKWTSSKPNIATIDSSTGLARAIGEGRADIIATVETGEEGGTSLIVGPSKLKWITITPGDTIIAKGQQVQFAAEGRYTDTTRDITSSVEWVSSNPSAAAIDSRGLATGVTPGDSTQITAKLWEERSAPSVLTVEEKKLEGIIIVPESPVIALGDSLQFRAVLSFTDGDTTITRTAVSWHSTDSTVAEIDTTGLVISKKKGNTTIIAERSGVESDPQVLTVIRPELEKITITAEKSMIAAGEQQRLEARGTFKDGTSVYLTSSVAWTSGDTSIAVVVPTTGLVTTVKQGTTTIEAQLWGVTSDSYELTVGPAKLMSIEIVPGDTTVALGETCQFKATGTYTNGDERDITSSVTWSLNDTVATIAPGGLAESIGQGETEIRANSEGIESPPGNLTVDPPRLLSIVVTPVDTSIVLGQSVQFAAAGTYTDGNERDITSLVEWTSSEEEVATVHAAGLVTSIGKGSTKITAAFDAVTSEARELAVRKLALISVILGSPEISLGETAQFRAIGSFTEGDVEDLTSAVVWSSSSDSVATIDSMGLATSHSEGTTEITARLGEITSAPQILTVASSRLVSIEVAPEEAKIALGLSLQYTATGTYTDAARDITSQVTWQSSYDSVATIDSTGLATSQAEGTTEITAELAGIMSDSQILMVGRPELASIRVTPGDTAIVRGQTVQYEAEGTYTDGTKKNITSDVDWESFNEDVAPIESGLAVSVGEGKTDITATLDEVKSDPHTLTVAPRLESIVVTSEDTTMVIGQTMQFRAEGTYTDGNERDITSLVEWTSSEEEVATVDAAGLVTSIGKGSTKITATFDTVTSEARLTVRKLELISATLLSPEIALGETEQLIATGIFAEGSEDITSMVVWSSSDETVATIDSTGLVTSIGEGTTEITARLGEKTSDPQILTVGPPRLESIGVEPAEAAIALGQPLQYTAMGTYEDATTADITSRVTWQSSDTTVATIDSTGLVTSLSEGTIEITATLGEITSAPQTLTVGQPGLISIRVTPADTTTIAPGDSLQYVATGTYTDGSEREATSSADWSSSDETVATIDSAGLAKALLEGETKITATVEDVSGEAMLIVRQ